jgi:phage anti-repressor protein
VLALDARELHQFLGAKRDFSNWIKKRLTVNKFVEGEDFTLANSGELANPGLQTRIDYILELNTAKELAMQERNDKGRMVRKYFIECERKINEAQHITEQAPNQPATENPPFLETKQECLLNKAFHDRVLFWTLEKRDRIYHPGIDRLMIFSITKNIFAALAAELLDESILIFSNIPTSISKLIRFINQWEPEFFREKSNVA